jgi:hypothetical protein
MRLLRTILIKCETSCAKILLPVGSTKKGDFASTPSFFVK